MLPVKMLVPIAEECSFPVSSVYSYNANRRARCLQKLCFWVLKKLGCEHYEVGYTAKTIDVNFDDIVKQVLDTSNAIDLVHHYRPKYLLLGHDKMVELGCATEALMQISFPHDYRRPPVSFAGMKVVLVPWMEGLLLVPELE